jgi:peptide subunit release factor 1 (eRF1)
VGSRTQEAPVPVIAEDVIRSLVGFKGEKAPVTSCYLDVDGRKYLRHQDLEHEVGVLLRNARTKANGHVSVRRDLHRIEELVKGGLDRSRTRGLAIFACSEHDLWEVIALPVPVQNRVVINHMPAVAQLEAVLEESKALGVLLADKQRARMFVFELGDLVEHSELFEELPRDYDTRGHSDQGDVAHHRDALKHQHLRHAADVALAVLQKNDFENLVIGAPDEIGREIESLLHPYLRDRLFGRVHLTVGAGLEDIRIAAVDVEQQIERREEDELVQRLREAVGSGRRGVGGLSGVLAALTERRAERVLVSQGYREAGWRCAPCGSLAIVGRKCGRCGAEMEALDDVVEEAIDEALAQSCRVEICVGNADLDVLGRIGALLRY